MKKTKQILQKARESKKIIAVIAVVLIGGWLLSTQVFGKNDEDINADSVQTLDQSFNFQGRNSSGQRVDQALTLKFHSVSKQEEVLVQGQRAIARNNKRFLVFDVGVTNNSSNILYLNLIDLVRLVESEDVKLAPQVHQGTLEIRPQSTKKSNVGFVIQNNVKDFSVQVGELNGDKESFDLEIK